MSTVHRPEGSGNQADRDKATKTPTPTDNRERRISLVVADHDAPPPAQPHARPRMRDRSAYFAVGFNVIEVDPKIIQLGSLVFAVGE